MQVSVHTDTKKAMAYLDRVQRKQIPYAIKSALDATAFDARRAVQVQLPRKLDRPTPATIKGVRVGKATKSGLMASVYFVDYVADYMKFQIAGGTRRPKRRAIPMPVAMARNKYGNMTKGGLQKLIARPNTFVGEIEGVAGVWDRKTGRLLVAWASAAEYKPRFPFQKIVHGVARSRFDRNFKRSLRHALRTAR